jgi:DNA repair protein RecO (recombination protein O)
MVEWKDQGIIVGIRPFGEKDGIVYVLTHHHGCYGGIVKNIKSRHNQSLQVGTLAACHWKARLSEHMGTWSLEAEKSYLADIFTDSHRLLALTVAAQLTIQLLPERHPYINFFEVWRGFLTVLSAQEEWWRAYVLFEYNLLQELGFGLKLASCAVTNTAENLKYVSPKTGCAVTENVGSSYHSKLLPLPAFFTQDEEKVERDDIVKGLMLTGYFLIKHFSEPKYANIFQTRQRFIDTL